MKSLKGMTWDHPRAVTCLEAASKVYAAQTGVTVEWDKRSLQAFADAPIRDLAQTHDLIILDHPHVGQIAETGCLVPLAADVSAARSIGGSFESYAWQGQQWAYPVDAACQMAVRRLDMSAPFPAHWEDTGSSEAASYQLITPLLPVDAFDMMMTLVAGRGEPTLAQSEKHFCSDENGLWALQILKNLYRLGPSDACGMNPITVLEILSNTDEFAASPCLFGYINYARAGFRPHLLRYEDLPMAKGYSTRCSILGGAGVGVSSLRDSTEAACAFASWVSGETIQSTLYIENEGQPAHFDAWLSLRDTPKYRGFLDGAFDTMSTAWTRPRSHWFLDFVDEVCDIFPAFFLKDRDCGAFLADINSLYIHYSRGKA